MPYINFSIKEEFNTKIEDIAKKLGIGKSDYIKSLITEDLKKYIKQKNGR